MVCSCAIRCTNRLQDGQKIYSITVGENTERRKIWLHRINRRDFNSRRAFLCDVYCAMELRCVVQNYHWGKLGHDSKVAELSAANDPHVVINKSEPYAEFWMGTHVNGPSVIKNTDKKLGEWIKNHPQSLGQKVIDDFGMELPFLFKVLSVQQALSIQVHPSKEHAEELHKNHPDVYKDPNHKPELAIALTSFEALCGFRQVHEIKDFLKNVPELRAVVGETASQELLSCSEEDYRTPLVSCFRSLMTCDKTVVRTELANLVSRISSLDESSQATVMGMLLKQLYTDFSGDVGCFAVYFLNYIRLNVGDAIYLAANEPHAYLYGDCVECMACSDNVVRAGLTPKYKDVETLCSMLTYICRSPDSLLFQPNQEDDCTQIFRPPVKDFAVAYIKIPANMKSYQLLPQSSASILLVIGGHGSSGELTLKLGSVIFLKAEEQLNITNIDSLVMFQAFANV